MRVRTFLTALAVCAAATLPAVPAALAVASLDADPVLLDETVASSQARQSGSDVVVDSLTTEYSTVSARPDGTFVLETSNQHVRVQRDGHWLDIDLTLQRNDDGTIGPKVAALDMAFSGGGSQNLASLAVPGSRLNLDWQAGPLPTPALDGDRATFAEVMPGVDLVVKAQPSGFAHFLVVKNAAAAANPALRTIRYGVRGEGVTVVERPGEALEAIDAEGKAIFSAPQPVMWDSPTRVPSPDQPASSTIKSFSTAADPLEATQDSTIVPMSVDVAPGQLAIQPDAAMLTSPETTFPLVIDPYWTGQKEGDNPMSGDTNNSAWHSINRDYPTTAYWKPEGTPGESWERGLQVGGGFQSFIRMDTDPLWRNQTRRVIVQDVDMTFDVKWAMNCSYGYIYLHASTGFNSGTTWNDAYDAAKPTEAKYWPVPGGDGSSQVGKANVGDKGLKECGNVDASNDIVYSGSPASNLGKLVQYAADHDYDYINLRLRPENYDTAANYKGFGLLPRLKVTYTHPPDVPSALKLISPAKTCTATVDATWIGDATPTLGVTTVDIDSGDLVTATFEVTRQDGTAVWTGTTAAAKPGAVSLTIPAGKLVDTAGGTQYRWRAKATQSGTSLSSAWSGWCAFTLDSLAPATPPVITSTQFPADQLVSGYDPAAGGWQPGVFAVDPAGTSDVVTYGYVFNDGAEAFTTVTAGGPTNLPFTPSTPGRQSLKVRTLDRAGNSSPLQSYYFKVAGPAPVAIWRLNEPTGSTANASRLDGNTEVTDPDSQLTFTGSAVLGRDGNKVSVNPSDLAVALSGSAYGATTQPVVRTDASFAVTAWVKLDDLSVDQVAVSQAGATGSMFELGWIGGKWTFRLRAADGQDDTFTMVATPATLEGGRTWLNRWAFLAARYDQRTGMISVHVNTPADPPLVEGGPPVKVISAPVTVESVMTAPTWSAGGPFTVGTARNTPSSWARHLVGTIDDVRVYLHADDAIIRATFGDES
ncbi:LamG domain-containing protein [Nonomuraea soli]|uniref:LamG-like jellyroll fold domain-containing protein n=1 Tax=Nonomuraea soli TaxID=1032476 RepID=A0A7W0CV33_9ACTN|nr:LamG domain-containing protein [Nonomuraea soli]MBA2897795.1 hypothetical protein [Nonomuraea soli]